LHAALMARTTHPQKNHLIVSVTVANRDPVQRLGMRNCKVDAGADIAKLAYGYDTLHRITSFKRDDAPQFVAASCLDITCPPL